MDYSFIRELLDNELVWTGYIPVVLSVVAIVCTFGRDIIRIVKNKKAKITIIPNKHLFINYYNSKITLKFYFSLLSKDIETIVDKVLIKLMDLDGNVIYEFEWDTFYATHYESYSTECKNNIMPKLELNRDVLTYSYPIYLKKEVPQLMCVSFVNDDLKNTGEVNLKPGEYYLLFEIKNIKGGIFPVEFPKEYVFTLKEADINKLKNQRTAKYQKNISVQPVKITISPNKKSKWLLRIENCLLRFKNQKY